MDDLHDALRRWNALKSERSSWISHWEELSRLMLPRSGRFLTSKRNRGEKRHQRIYDGSGTRALRILAAGLQGGMTSPARPWFRLATADPDLNKSPAVKAWLADVTRLMLDIFAKSNTYRALHQGYEELGAFGTFASVVAPDYRTVIHHHPLTVGEYAIAQDWRGMPNTLYREFDKTVAEVVREFGLENCTRATQEAYRAKNFDAWISVTHAIEPRDDYDSRKADSRNMPWRSCYIEAAAPKGKFLREGGFKEFPALVARWATQGGDIYGTSPAMDALGDLGQLQHQQLRKAEAIDYQTKPPLQAPTALKDRDIDMLPGGLTFFDGAQGQGVRSLFDVRLDLNGLLMDIQDVRQRIGAHLYTDMFLLAANATDTQKTATEIAEKHEEKMLVLGPVLERLHNEALDPLIEMTFARMVETRILPPPPLEMEEQQLNVEFVSILAQAQRAISTNGIDRWVMALGTVAGLGRTDALDKLDVDTWADTYGDLLGVDPHIIVANDQVALIREQRAQQQAAAQQAAVAEQAASAAQKLGSVPTGPGAGNAANDVLAAFSGYT